MRHSLHPLARLVDTSSWMYVQVKSARLARWLDHAVNLDIGGNRGVYHLLPKLSRDHEGLAASLCRFGAFAFLHRNRQEEFLQKMAGPPSRFLGSAAHRC